MPWCQISIRPYYSRCITTNTLSSQQEEAEPISLCKWQSARRRIIWVCLLPRVVTKQLITNNSLRQLPLSMEWAFPLQVDPMRTTTTRCTRPWVIMPKTLALIVAAITNSTLLHPMEAMSKGKHSPTPQHLHNSSRIIKLNQALSLLLSSRPSFSTFSSRQSLNLRVLMAVSPKVNSSLTMAMIALSIDSNPSLHTLRNTWTPLQAASSSRRPQPVAMSCMVRIRLLSLHNHKGNSITTVVDSWENMPRIPQQTIVVHNQVKRGLNNWGSQVISSDRWHIHLLTTMETREVISSPTWISTMVPVTNRTNCESHERSEKW
jgi:hypothetical protein